MMIGSAPLMRGCALNLEFPRGCFFVPVEVYLDESGIHNGSRRCVVAGYCGGRRKLILLERDWLKTLDDFGIPREEGFHAKDFFKRSKLGKRFGPYEGWSDRKAREFLASLLHAIDDQGLNAVGGAVFIEYFNSLPHNLRRWLTGGIYDAKKGKWLTSGAPGKPYFLRSIKQ